MIPAKESLGGRAEEGVATREPCRWTGRRGLGCGWELAGKEEKMKDNKR